jgi:two-component system, LuxR family, response regulator FixJ
MDLPHAAPNGERMVFVVDDDEAVLNSLRFSLEIDEFKVCIFRSGAELLALSAFPESACLVLDYHLPGRDGLQTLAALRKRGVRLPAILITSDPSDAVRGRAAAASVMIVEKPFLGNALFNAIRQAFSPIA